MFVWTVDTIAYICKQSRIAARLFSCKNGNE